MKFSKELQGKIEELKSLKESLAKSNETIKTHNEKVAEELVVAKEELKAAMEAMGDDPSEENRIKENEMRRKVASLELEVSGAVERKSAVTNSKNMKIMALHEEVLRDARKEILVNYESKKDETLETIAKAKQAYLEAAKAYHDLIMVDSQGKYYDLARELGTNERMTKDNAPNLSVHHPIYTDRASGPNKYGIIEPEVYRAWRRGEIK
ncbi:hypothetical protein AB1K91_02595 [Terribacillus sp. 179-K 1B1 HS]|uniref:hypothetical protein n=1 Tax=Terribacillus sp. 179-K 1B1 HS TaxID=3142388 RepID=UPI0039A26918